MDEAEKEARAQNQARFELELEFVQCLANPYYLQTLAQQGILDKPAFINYLKYLLYWKETEYARFIIYPHALHHLELLQQAQFREDIKHEEWRIKLQHAQYEHWRTWRNEPNKNVTANGASAAPGAAAAAPSTSNDAIVTENNPV